MSRTPVRHGNTIIFPASLDPKAVSVVKRLTESGFQSYLVGGCVRDLLLGRIPKDFDASTEARPRQIRRVFRNCRIIGRRFKLAHVHFGEQIIEVATFRRNPAEAGEDDGEPGDETEAQDTDDLLITRDNVYGSAEEDILRRDFTMNALLYDVATDEVIDYVGGFEDLERRVLRTIGDPMIRLAEDPVRMLRAVKFTSRLDLALDPEFAVAMRASAELIGRSAPPRVLEEIYKLLTCGRAERSLDMLVEYGLLQQLLPEIAAHWEAHRPDLTALGRALDVVDAGQRRVGNAFLLAALFHGPWRAALGPEEQQDAAAAARDLLTSAALRMNIPRRDVAIVKLLLATQLRLERPRRSRRFRMSDFLGRTSTRESIDLLHVRALSGEADPELHAAWAERLARSGPPAGREPVGVGEGRERTGRRRRRRGDKQGPGGESRRGESRRRQQLAPAEADALAAATALPAGEPARTSPVDEAQGVAAPADPAGLRGRVRSWFQRILGSPDPEAPAESVAISEPAPDEPAAVAAAPAPELAEPGSGAASEGQPSRRRRRRRRGRGSRRREEGAAAAPPAGDVQQNGNTPPGDATERPRKRRSRRGRGRGRSEATRERAEPKRERAVPKRERAGGDEKRQAERPSRQRRRSRGGDREGDRQTERDQSPASTTAPPTPQHRPEDIEDVFDW